MSLWWSVLLPVAAAALGGHGGDPVTGPGRTEVGIDLAAPPEQVGFEKFWQSSVGSGHAVLGLRPDWQQQLKAVHDDLGIKGVRFHGSFDDDMGPVVTKVGGKLVYNFTLLDVLYDGIMAAGIKPIVELSFMPTAIANCTPGHCHTTMHYRGVTEHPREYSLWGDLVEAFTRHLVARHGLAEIMQWRFEVWNELWGVQFGDGSTGKPEDSPYMALYNASYHAIKSVSPGLSIGGPATMELRDVADFIQAMTVWGIGSDAPDFVSTHTYPTDSCNSARDARTNLDCFTDAIIAAREQAANHTFLLTEFNCGWQDTEIHDGESKAYAASFMLRTVNNLRDHGMDALSWWTFSAIFEEGGLPTNEFGPFGANSALQSVHGVPMPIYRGFQLLADAGDEVLEVTEGGARVNRSASTLTVMATRNSSTNTMHMFLGNFAPDDGKGGAGTDGTVGPVMSRAGATCSKSDPSPCTEKSCYLPNTDFPGGDLVPEKEKFKTDNASACCDACLHYKVDKFCQAWVWKAADDGDSNRCYLKGFGMGPPTRSAGLTAGYPNGIPPPPPSNRPWYRQNRTVSVTVKSGKHWGDGATPGPGTAIVRMINSTCANPKAVWTGAMKSVTWPSEAQIATLKTASQMCEESIPVAWAADGTATLELTLEAYAMAEIAFDLPHSLAEA